MSRRELRRGRYGADADTSTTRQPLSQTSYETHTFNIIEENSFFLSDERPRFLFWGAPGSFEQVED